MGIGVAISGRGPGRLKRDVRRRRMLVPEDKGSSVCLREWPDWILFDNLEFGISYDLPQVIVGILEVTGVPSPKGGLSRLDYLGAG